MQLVRSIGKIFPLDSCLFFADSLPVKGRQADSVPAAQPAEAFRRPAWAALVCLAATVLSLAPFANKAFHIDDTLFLYAARQICAHPADPFGFKVNWYGPEMPMAEVTQNGPLASYYIALVASCFGWSETALHLAFLVPAVAAVLGTYFLAARFCTRAAAGRVGDAALSGLPGFQHDRHVRHHDAGILGMGGGAVAAERGERESCFRDPLGLLDCRGVRDQIFCRRLP